MTDDEHETLTSASTAPKAFISHASEDKERFVVPFATQLRESGVDAWVDQWEIGPGDSLVQRIFDEGIASADAFIVVLSHESVRKPWVREELDAGVVKRIITNRSTRLIPIVLDRDVVVPAALKHLVWESVADRGFEHVLSRVLDQLLGRSTRPALGRTPTYVSTNPRWTTTSADEVVFELLMEELRNHDGAGWVLFSNDIQARAAQRGISSEQFHESMQALRQEGLANFKPMLGGARYMLHSPLDRVWLRFEASLGTDVPALRRAVLATLLNEKRDRFEPPEFGAGYRTLGAILRQLKSEGLLEFAELVNGAFVVQRVSPSARRALDQG